LENPLHGLLLFHAHPVRERPDTQLQLPPVTLTASEVAAHKLGSMEIQFL